ncbi:MAG: hypothetical protein HC926_06025 [Synechococcaceae cyanobacterium SM2_3_60]|nr:hypothetical protein [Synechococcaceae cyanobacterium SM2_3_60]
MMQRLWCLLSVLMLLLMPPALAESPAALGDVQSRLDAIVSEMAYVRFCKRTTCRYKDIEVNLLSTDDPDMPYKATIDAIMDRPSTMVDKAHYLLEFQDDRWHLIGGEELSDVSSFVFAGDEYEVFSSYSGRTRISHLSNADSTLRVGYRDLYYLIMNEGEERV